MRRRLAQLCATGGVALVVTAAAGCEYPKDPEGSLERVRSEDRLRVGVVENPPWVDLSGPQPRGVEPTLVREFAGQLGARVEWTEAPEAQLAEALKGFQLDLVVGGLTRHWPDGREVGLTRPYVDTEIEIGVPPGTDFDDDLSGERIWVEANSEEAALLKQEEEDAIPVRYEALAEVDGPALLPTYEIDAIGYERTDYILRDNEHAMAVPPGENALLVELEHFLLDRGEEAEDLLHREAERSTAGRLGP